MVIYFPYSLKIKSGMPLSILEKVKSDYNEEVKKANNYFITTYTNGRIIEYLDDKVTIELNQGEKNTYKRDKDILQIVVKDLNDGYAISNLMVKFSMDLFFKKFDKEIDDIYEILDISCSLCMKSINKPYIINKKSIVLDCVKLGTSYFDARNLLVRAFVDYFLSTCIDSDEVVSVLSYSQSSNILLREEIFEELAKLGITARHSYY